MNEETRLETPAEADAWAIDLSALSPEEADSEASELEALERDPTKAETQPQAPEVERPDTTEATSEAAGETDRFFQKQSDEVTAVSKDTPGGKEKQDQDFAEFIREYPDVLPTSVPKGVWELYSQGKRTLVQAFEKHENVQLKARLAAEEKNAENRQRSTGSATTAGTSSPKDALDLLWDND